MHLCALVQRPEEDPRALVYCSLPYSFRTLSLTDPKSQQAPRILLSPSTRLGSQADKAGPDNRLEPRSSRLHSKILTREISSPVP